MIHWCFLIEGKVSFKNRSLHSVGDTLNPYESAISVIGKTLAPFDEDNLIPCFGFGDGTVKSRNLRSHFQLTSSMDLLIHIGFSMLTAATTHDREVFSFHSDNSPCHGFDEVLTCYKRIVPNLKLSGQFFDFFCIHLTVLISTSKPAWR